MADQYKTPLIAEWRPETEISRILNFANFHEQGIISHCSRESTRQVLEGIEASQYIESIRKGILEVLFDPVKLTLRAESPDVLEPGRSFIVRAAVFVHTRQINADGSVKKWKSRCSWNGKNMSGVDSETFSPTIGALSLSVLHQIVIRENMIKAICDTTAAYLNEVYPEEEFKVEGPSSGINFPGTYSFR